MCTVGHLAVSLAIKALNTSSNVPLNPPNVTIKNVYRDFPGGAVVKNPPANARDTGSSPGLGRSHMPRSN